MEDIRSLPGLVQTRAVATDLPEEDDDKYWLRIVASNPELDGHNSYMDVETTLKNYVEDAKSRLGVALTDHHAYRSFGYGRSTDARLTDANEVLIDFFILKHMEYEGGRREFRTSEKLIRAIENDLVNQVSVEFYGAREICNICKLPYRRSSWWDEYDMQPGERCSHKMGKAYEIDGKRVRATYTVYDARLKAVSLVEFGSNRETSIEKKREMAAALDWVFREKPGALLAGISTEVQNKIKENIMEDKDWVANLREKLGVSTIRSDDAPDVVLEKLETDVTQLRETVETQRDEIADLQADAEDGQAYRAARIEEAIKQGTRAHGDAFDEAYHREYYADLPMDKLNAAIENNKKLGDAALPAGRSTTDTHEPPPERKKASLRDRKKRGRRR